MTCKWKKACKKILEKLEYIIANDKTIYDYAFNPIDASNPKDEMPPKGERWKTPKEIAKEIKSMITDSTDTDILTEGEGE